MKKILITLLFVLAISGCGGNTNSNSQPEPQPQQTQIPAQKILSVPYYPQMTQVWCWAATEQMILSAMGYQYAQDYIVTATYGYPMYLTASMQQIQMGLYNLGGINSYITGPLSFEAVKQTIANNKPIIIGYNGSFAGHVVVLYGYDENGNVYINDPYFGQFVVPFGVSIIYNGGGSNLFWQSTIIIT